MFWRRPGNSTSTFPRSATPDLRELVRREQERKWRENHADFIAAYNATVQAEGLPLEAWRNF